MKTALQQAIDRLEGKISDRKQKAIGKPKKEKDFLQEEIHAIRECINDIKELLPTEREQIEKAFMDGQENLSLEYGGLSDMAVQLTDYYNKTYGNETQI